jgi:hypothetical protein
MKKCPKCEKLNERIRQLKERLQLLESKPTLQAGFSGEQIISKLVNGIPTAFHSPHDVTTVRRGKRLEVKFSNLNTAVKGARTKRWSWANALGISGKKIYHRLILVGEADPEVDYGDIENGPYIFFDVPFGKVSALIRESGLIQISTNPKTARTDEAKLLFGKYLLSPTSLQERYGL